MWPLARRRLACCQSNAVHACRLQSLIVPGTSRGPTPRVATSRASSRASQASVRSASASTPSKVTPSGWLAPSTSLLHALMKPCSPTATPARSATTPSAATRTSTPCGSWASASRATRSSATSSPTPTPRPSPPRSRWDMGSSRPASRSNMPNLSCRTVYTSWPRLSTRSGSTRSTSTRAPAHARRQAPASPRVPSRRARRPGAPRRGR